jgi:hypothetical protein
MRTRLLQIAKKMGGLLMIELFVPGGTLIVLTMLLMGGSAPAIPAKVAALAPGLNRLLGFFLPPSGQVGQ